MSLIFKNIVIALQFPNFELKHKMTHKRLTNSLEIYSLYIKKKVKVLFVLSSPVSSITSTSEGSDRIRTSCSSGAIIAPSSGTLIDI